MVPRFRLDPPWISQTADAIISRDGVLLKECIVNAVSGKSVGLQDDSNESVTGLVDHGYESLEVEIQRVSTAKPVSGTSSKIISMVEAERRHLTAAMVRVAVTGALAKYQETHRVIYKVDASEMEKEEASEEELVNKTVHNTLLRGLLFAFEAFQEVHSMPREHYPPRQGPQTKGTVGWDTLILLYFVHHIPHVAREASGVVVDEATAELIRQWRKLLVALQSADGHEAPERSRRRGTLSIVNGLLMILFSRYNTHQCNVLVAAVESAERLPREAAKSFLQPSQHMTSEVLTYYYFKGRLALYGHRFEEALESLRYAYSLLPPFPNASPPQCKNKFRVRFYMCIAAIITGKTIPPAVLDEDSILKPILVPLITSIQRGDPIAFHLAMETFSSTFRRRGVYLILQQCKHLCALMLLARVHAILGTIEGFDNSRIPLAALVAAQQTIIDEGIEESQNSIASPTRRKEHDDVLALHHTNDDTIALAISQLIAGGWVRGYLSYEHRTLVLSKAMPFPTLQQPISR